MILLNVRYVKRCRPTGNAVAEPVEVRLWRMVDRSGGPDACWPFIGKLNKGGYGRITLLSGRRVQAHRVAYELVKGPIPEGKQLDHLCRNRACCNPGHHEPVTGKVNTLRGNSFSARFARQTQCKNGHVYTPETMRQTKHQRVCRVCERLKKERRKEMPRANTH